MRLNHAIIIAANIGAFNKKAAADTRGHRPQPVYSNFRLIATMRSRSKKGEAGLCCAQPFDRPEPIVIMVLPTEYQPESLICSRGPNRSAVRQRVIVSAARRRRWSGFQNRGHESETLHHNSSLRKPFRHFSYAKSPHRRTANVVPNNRSARCMQTVYRAFAVSLSALVPARAFP